jgi:hypothetical protein
MEITSSNYFSSFLYGHVKYIHIYMIHLNLDDAMFFFFFFFFICPYKRGDSN